MNFLIGRPRSVMTRKLFFNKSNFASTNKTLDHAAIQIATWLNLDDAMLYKSSSFFQTALYLLFNNGPVTRSFANLTGWSNVFKKVPIPKKKILLSTIDTFLNCKTDDEQ